MIHSIRSIPLNDSLAIVSNYHFRWSHPIRCYCCHSLFPFGVVYCVANSSSPIHHHRLLYVQFQCYSSIWCVSFHPKFIIVVCLYSMFRSHPLTLFPYSVCFIASQIHLHRDRFMSILKSCPFFHSQIMSIFPFSNHFRIMSHHE